MTLRVIGVGFGRMGTLSLKVALERLGFAPCEHMLELLDDPARVQLWEVIARQRERGESIDWERLFASYGATVDWPGAAFWRELATAYPEAKIILTVRDPDRWYASAFSTIHAMRRMRSGSPLAVPFFALVGRLAPKLARVQRLTDEVIWNGVFDGRFVDRAHAIALFKRHHAAVEAEIPPDRLLVFEVRQGWEPLCQFLGVEVPDEPFPHLNDASEFQLRVRRQLVTVTGILGGGIVVAVAVLIAIARWLRRR